MASFEELKKRVASGQTSAAGNKTGKTSFQDIKKRASEEKFEAEVKKVDSSYIDSFLESANRFYDTAQEDYDKVGWGNASTTYMNRRDTYNNLDYKRRVIQKWMEANQGSFDADSYKSFSDSLAQFGTGASGILDSFSKAREFYSQFDSEDAYNLWKYREDYISAYQADPEKATSAFGYDHDLIREAQYRAEKTKVMGAEDFQDYNQYVSNVKYGLGGKPSFTDDTYAYINNPTVEDKRWGGGEITARELIKANDATYKWDTPLRGSESTEEKNALDYLDDDEIAIYNYYYAKEGKERADEYLALVQETLNQRKAEVIVGDIQSMFENLGWEPEITTEQVPMEAAIQQMSGSGFVDVVDPLTGEVTRVTTQEQMEGMSTSGMIEVVSINGDATVYRGGGGNVTQPSGGGGGGGGKPKKAETVKKSDVVERYKQVND